MRYALLLSACLLLLCSSCRREESSYSKAMELLPEKQPEAVRLFEQAILQDDHAPQAHYELALIYDKEPSRILLLAWHLGEYLRLSENLTEQERQKTEEWLDKTERRLSIAINKRIGENITDEASMRIRLLEEFAARQKAWIQQLNDENLELRKALAEQQGRQ